jgi:hypothetical protein
MTITQRTAEEASKYILESIENWKSAGQDKKIISLSNLAEKWRSDTSGPSAKIKLLHQSIKALELILKRNENVGIPLGQLGDQLEYLKKEYKDLIDKYGEPKPKVKKGGNK